jgi:hypothetical protein
MAFDNLKVKWNGQIPKANGKFITKGLALHDHGRVAHAAAAHLVSGDAHHEANPVAHTGAAFQLGAQTGFHSELLALGETHAGGLTGQFQLPAIEHFGT